MSGQTSHLDRVRDDTAYAEILANWDAAFYAKFIAALRPAVTSDAPPATTGAAANRLVLDNYESPVALSKCNLLGYKPVVVAFGPERGWSAAERDLFRAHAFTFAHLGPRVLRTETAVIAAVALIRAKLGLL